VSFGAKDLFKLTDDNFASIIKDDWKLRCNHLVSTGAQYVAGEDLDEGQEMFVHVGNDSSDMNQEMTYKVLGYIRYLE
jgi:hypothetical protein